MKKRDKIIYWIATIWLALGLVSTGGVQLFQVDSEVDYILKMGYPAYFLILMGAWKILGAVAVLIPKFPLLKEWAYAGIFFNMTGAIFSHIAVGNSMGDIFPPLLILTLAAVSYYFRPVERKVSLVTR